MQVKSQILVINRVRVWEAGHTAPPIFFWGTPPPGLPDFVKEEFEDNTTHITKQD